MDDIVEELNSFSNTIQSILEHFDSYTIPDEDKKDLEGRLEELQSNIEEQKDHLVGLDILDDMDPKVFAYLGHFGIPDEQAWVKTLVETYNSYDV